MTTGGGCGGTELTKGSTDACHRFVNLRWLTREEAAPVHGADGSQDIFDLLGTFFSPTKALKELDGQLDSLVGILLELREDGGGGSSSTILGWHGCPLCTEDIDTLWRASLALGV